MNIKKFQAETEKEAILMAKEELGKEAIVMNIKTIKPKGINKLFQKSKVEITAAVDDLLNVQATDNNKVNLTTNSNVIKQQESLLKNENIIPESSAIEDKLNNLQNLLEKNMQTYQTQTTAETIEDDTKAIEKPQNSCFELIRKQLLSNELDPKYIDEILNELEDKMGRETSIDNVLSKVYQKIILKIGQLKPISLEKGQKKYVFFIGPTGVGKTTTIAKIASSLKLVDNKKVALVTADTYRIAAVEQLRTYANILNIPIHVIYKPNEFKDIENELKEYDVVLVDTAGRSHKNEEQKEDLFKLISSIPLEQREIYLVLSATTKYNDLIKIADTYKSITDYSLIFTKLDETSCIGNILNIKLYTGYPLSYCTWGQNVPDDIGQVSAQKIAKQLLGGSD